MCPFAGLLGLKNAMLTATKGTAVLNTHFADYAPWLGDISVRELGSLTAYETGQVTTYALMSIEARGRLFVSPGQDIYEGQVRPTVLAFLPDATSHVNRRYPRLPKHAAMVFGSFERYGHFVEDSLCRLLASTSEMAT